MSTIRIQTTPRTLRVAAGACLLTGIVTSVAALWPSSDDELAAEAVPIVVESQSEPISENLDDAGAAVEETAVEPEIQIAIEHSEPETPFAERADELILEGKLDEAFVALRKHLFTVGEDAELLFRIGNLGRELKDYEIAERALGLSAALEPRSEVYSELARVRLNRDDHAGAEEAAEEAIRIDTEDPYAWNMSGRVAMAQSRWQQAEIAFRHAVELDPTNAMIHNNLGLLYIFMQEGEQAADALETAVELYEHDVPAYTWNNLGLAYEKMEAFDRAEEAFEEALRINPRYTNARVNLQRLATLVAIDNEKKRIEGATASLVVETEDDVDFEEDIDPDFFDDAEEDEDFEVYFEVEGDM